MFLNQKVALDYEDRYGKTALDYAFEFYNTRVISSLLKAGVGLGKHCSKGKEILLFAAGAGDVDLIR